MLQPPSVPGIGTGGGLKGYVQDRAARGLPALEGAAWIVAGSAMQTPGFTQAFTLFNTHTPQLYADIDRTKAELLGVPISRVFEALSVYMGSAYINDFNILGRTYRVTAQADNPYRLTPRDVENLKTVNATGDMVPIGSVATFRDITGPFRVARYNLYPAAEVQFNLARGYSTGQGIKAVEKIAAQRLPPGFAFEWTEIALQEKLAGNTAVIAFGLAVVFVFLLLAALYESWLLPLAVILIVPMCILAAMIGVNIRGLDRNILVEIGLVVLVGLAAKNAILIVEFARQAEDGGHEPVGCRRGCGEDPVAAYSDDVVRVHSRRGAAGDFNRGRGGDAPVAGHCGVRRHAGRHRFWPAVHAGVLRDRPEVFPWVKRWRGCGSETPEVLLSLNPGMSGIRVCRARWPCGTRLPSGQLSRFGPDHRAAAFAMFGTGILSIRLAQTHDLRAPERFAPQFRRFDPDLAGFGFPAGCGRGRPGSGLRGIAADLDSPVRRVRMRRGPDHLGGVGGGNQRDPRCQLQRFTGNRHIHLLETMVEQGCHVDVAFRVGGGTQHNANQPYSAAHGAGDKVVAGCFGVAGLQSVRARVGAQHIVVVEDDLPVPGEAGGREVAVVSGEIVDQTTAQDRQVAGGCPLFGVRQSGRVHERAVFHAERAGAQGHHLGEAILAASKQFPQGGGGVIGRFGDQAQNGLFHGQAGAGQQPQLGRFHAGGVGGHGYGLVKHNTPVAQRFERKIQGHHFGQAGRMTQLVGVHVFQHIAAGGIDHDGTIPRRPDLRLRRGKDEETRREAGGGQQAAQKILAYMASKPDHSSPFHHGMKTLCFPAVRCPE